MRHTTDTYDVRRLIRQAADAERALLIRTLEDRAESMLNTNTAEAFRALADALREVGKDA